MKIRRAQIVGLFLLIGSTTCITPLFAGFPAALAAQRSAHPAGSQLAELKGSDTLAGDGFGWSVAMSGAFVVVGAWGHSKDAGRAYVFNDEAGRFRQLAELKGADTTAGDNFGWAVSISGSDLVVGAPGYAANAARAYVFARSSSRWSQVAELKGSDTRAGDRFGTSVAVSGTELVVGASDHAADAGRAYVFSITGGHIAQLAELKGSDTVAGDGFGASVAISATTAIVGAPSSVSRAGRAYLFEKTSTHWAQLAELKGSGVVPVRHLPGAAARKRPLGFGGAQFGYAVALSGPVALVSEPGESSGTVPVYIFEKTPSAPRWRSRARASSWVHPGRSVTSAAPFGTRGGRRAGFAAVR
ncbi:MAG: FG-GAP repeat protein [Acidimicrobiales bacterium]